MKNINSIEVFASLIRALVRWRFEEDLIKSLHPTSDHRILIANIISAERRETASISSNANISQLRHRGVAVYLCTTAMYIPHF